MNTTTPKQAIAFPEVALIRKGNPKANNQVGKDLGDKFRVQFYPGVDPAILDTFTKAYGDTPKRIKAFIPFPNVWDAFSSFNEAHNAGRMIAQADQEKYLMKRNPLTGQYEVRNGEPYTPFQPGEKVSYTNAQGKTIELPVKTTNRLRLVIPEIVATGRLVTFTFKSTSVYDRFNLEQQLGAIQALANTLNRGNAAGIPFWLYRAEREITWNKPDGSASRIKKWLVHLEPDAEWVKATFERMSKFALTGGQNPTLPTSFAAPLEMEQEFGEEDDEDEDDAEGIIETTARTVPVEQPASKPANGHAPKPQTTPPTRAKLPANAAPNVLLRKFENYGQALWHDAWPTVRAMLLKNQDPASLSASEFKKALAFVEKREDEIGDFGVLLTHVEKAWPEATSFLPLAYANLEAALGVPPNPLDLIAAVAQAVPELTAELTPEAGALVITERYEPVEV